jgi:hypothetical protein
MSDTPEAGFAFASMAANIALLTLLVEKRIVTRQELVERLDRASALLEEMSPDIPLRTDAHEVIEGILRIVQGLPEPPPGP